MSGKWQLTTSQLSNISSIELTCSLVNALIIFLLTKESYIFIVMSNGFNNSTTFIAIFPHPMIPAVELKLPGCILKFVAVVGTYFLLET